MSFGEESTRTDQPNFPPQRFLTKAIQTARKSRQRRTKWWVGLKMDLKIFWPDYSSVNTLPPKSQSDFLDLSVLILSEILIIYWFLISLARTRIRKYTKDGFPSLRRKKRFAEMKNRLLCICIVRKVISLDEFTDKHYKMTRNLFVNP